MERGKLETRKVRKGSENKKELGRETVNERRKDRKGSDKGGGSISWKKDLREIVLIQ